MAGDDAAARAAKICGAQGPRWFSPDDVIWRVHADTSMFLGGSDVDESVWLPVPAGTTVTAPLGILDLPVQRVAMARVEGPYTLISEAHGRIEEYIRANDLRVAARAAHAPVHHKVFNRYLNNPR